VSLVVEIGGVVKALNGTALDKKIHGAGWSFFFLADEVKGMFFGAIGAQKVQKAIKRILVKVKRHNFNCLEVTGIVAKRFLGMPYVTVIAHSATFNKASGYKTTINGKPPVGMRSGPVVKNWRKCSRRGSIH
jgi:hypothetical protein